VLERRLERDAPGRSVQTFALTTKSKHLVLEALLSLANNATARKGRLMDVILIARELIAAVELEDLTRCNTLAGAGSESANRKRVCLCGSWDRRRTDRKKKGSFRCQFLNCPATRLLTALAVR